MTFRTQKKIVRLLGVGFDTDDGHVRITMGENYDVLLGSDESHDYITQFIARIEDEIEKRGLNLDSLSPEELAEIVQTLR